MAVTADPEESSAAGAHLSPRHGEALARFVAFWGEMASSWGINRTMAQIHALLYAIEEPLDTDTIMARLQISRGNANMNLRSLVNWNLVRRVHRPGFRRDFYTAEKDVWEITLQIIRERERRELRPVMQQLQECRDLLSATGPPDAGSGRPGVGSGPPDAGSGRPGVGSGPPDARSPSTDSASARTPGEIRFAERIENLMRLVEVFEGLSRTLLPFIQVQNADMLRQLVQLADPFPGPLSGDPDAR